MSSEFAGRIKVSIFGQSHSEAIGVTIDGLPAGESIDLEELGAFLKRRAPGQNEYSTARREEDIPEILSGLKDGKTCDVPLCAIIKNKDVRSKDYENLRYVPRPGHADFPAHVKSGGFNDIRGGGHFSARLTAPMCIAGGIIIQMLSRRGIEIGAHIAEIAGIADGRFDQTGVSVKDFEALKEKAFPVIDDASGEKMKAAIMAAKADGDSVGGIVECAILGLPVGYGDPMYGGIENEIARSVFAVPAVKGIEFGAGFNASRIRGSENNDPFIIEDGKIKTATNNHGGILGGLASGMPVIFRAAFKPTPSIAKEQRSVNLSEMKETTLNINGRHDPCVVPRAVPCVMAAAAIAVSDVLYYI